MERIYDIEIRNIQPEELVLSNGLDNWISYGGITCQKDSSIKGQVGLYNHCQKNVSTLADATSISHLIFKKALKRSLKPGSSLKYAGKSEFIMDLEDVLKNLYGKLHFDPESDQFLSTPNKEWFRIWHNYSNNDLMRISRSMMLRGYDSLIESVRYKAVPEKDLLIIPFSLDRMLIDEVKKKNKS